MKSYYPNHPDDVRHYDTMELREKFLMEEVFEVDKVVLGYTHFDRMVFGGIMPSKKELKLDDIEYLATDFFFARREGGIINIGGGSATLNVDGTEYTLNNQDAIYISMGTKEVTFKAVDAANPPKLYLASTPAHKAYPTTVVTLEKANKVHLGADDTANKRTINQYIVPGIVEACQLVMGMTNFAPGNVWNTMPAHTHDRRMEVYLYFNMEADTKIFHFMGEPTETRHLLMSNEQAVISPSWSIHAGCGTGQYSFIWAMGGENMLFTDMDHVAMGDLR